MEEEVSEIAKDVIFEAIENQMRDRDPPVTKETYDRLTSEGHSHEETNETNRCALSVEMFEIMKNRKVFNEERYKTAEKPNFSQISRSFSLNRPTPPSTSMSLPSNDRKI